MIFIKSYVIHLLRHGAVEDNLSGRYVGRSNPSLCDEGKKQIRDFKSRFEYGNVDSFYSSPMKRCVETIKEIFGDVEIKTVEGLSECDMGDFEGKTPDELIDDARFNDWVSHGATPPNGESNKDFAKRVCSAFVQTVKEIMSLGKTEAVICTHGGVIMTIMAVYCLSGGNLTDYMSENCTGFSIRITPSIWMRSGIFELASDYPAGWIEALYPQEDEDLGKQTNNPFDDFEAENESSFIPLWADVNEDTENEEDEN